MRVIFQTIFITILFFGFNLNAQDGIIDSLKLELKSAKHDTIRCNILNAIIENESDDNVWPVYNEQLKKLSEQNLITSKNDKVLHNFYLKVFASTLNNIGYLAQQNGNLPRALEYLNKSLKIQEDMGDKQGAAQSLNNIGLVYDMLGNSPKVLECFFKSNKISHEIGDKVSEALGMTNIGGIYKNLGEISKALECHTKSLKILEELGDKKGAAQAINNIALIYDDQGDYEKGLEFHFKSLKIREEISHKKGIAESLNNIGYDYYKKKEKEKALDYYLRAEKIYTDAKSKSGITTVNGNLGSLYESNRDFKSALKCYDKSLKLDEEIGDKNGIAIMLKRMSSAYFNMKDYNKALPFALRAMEISKELDYPPSLKSAANLLFRIYKATGDSKNAFENYTLYISMRDSLNNQETQKASVRSQFKIEYDQKERQTKLEQEKKDIKNAKEKQKQSIIRNSFIVGFALMLILVIVILRSFLLGRKKNKVIEMQKILVEEKQKEILDSIYYAQRIQMALMPSQKYLEKILHKLQKKN